MSDAGEVEQFRMDLQLVGEALRITWAILDDLLDMPDVDRPQYEDDLNRLKQLAHLVS